MNIYLLFLNYLVKQFFFLKYLAKYLVLELNNIDIEFDLEFSISNVEFYAYFAFFFLKILHRI